MSDDPFATSKSYNSHQISTPFGQFVLRADSAVELFALYAELTDQETADRARAKVIADLKAVAAGQAESRSTPPPSTPTRSGGSGTSQKPLPEGTKLHPESVCDHGWPRYWKSWVRASDNKAFKGWFCQSDNQADQCKPDFVK